jgi:hypothetical protein
MTAVEDVKRRQVVDSAAGRLVGVVSRVRLAFAMTVRQVVALRDRLSYPRR